MDHRPAMRPRAATLGLLALLVLGTLAEAGGHYVSALGVLTDTAGAAAPDLALPDPAGKIHRLADFRGRLLLVSFGATW